MGTKLKGLHALNAAIRKRRTVDVEISTGTVTLIEPVNSLIFERLVMFPEVQSLILGFGVPVEDGAADTDGAGGIGLTVQMIAPLLPKLPRGFAEAIAMSLVLDGIDDTPPTADDIMALPNADFLKLRRAVTNLAAPEGLIDFFGQFVTWLGIPGVTLSTEDLIALKAVG